MDDVRDLTEEQAHWLRRVLQRRPRRRELDVFTIPAGVYEALVEKGFIRRMHGQVEISLDGIHAISRSAKADNPFNHLDRQQGNDTIMTNETELDAGERQWLIAIDGSPMTKSMAYSRVPTAVREALIAKDLVQWKLGFLEVALLETTSRGSEAVQRLRSQAAA